MTKKNKKKSDHLPMISSKTVFQEGESEEDENEQQAVNQ